MDYVLNLWVRLATDLYSLFLNWGLPDWGAKLILDFIIILILVILGVLAVIVLTPMERKVIARMQDRPGPNRAWPYGLSQAFADAIKMLTKEMIVPKRADRLTPRARAKETARDAHASPGRPDMETRCSVSVSRAWRPASTPRKRTSRRP